MYIRWRHGGEHACAAVAKKSDNTERTVVVDAGGLVGEVQRQVLAGRALGAGHQRGRGEARLPLSG